MSDAKLHYFVLICDKKKKDKFIEFLASQGALSIDTIYGKGSAKAGTIAQAFGLEVEEKKAVISCMFKPATASEVIDILCSKYGFCNGNTGVAFSIPIEGLVV